VTVYRNVSQEMALTGGGLGYRSSTEIELPFVRHTGEPLTLQFAHFLALVRGTPTTTRSRQIRPAHVLADAIEAQSQAGTLAALCRQLDERQPTSSSMAATTAVVAWSPYG
jgi:hypothetical protein